MLNEPLCCESKAAPMSCTRFAAQCLRRRTLAESLQRGLSGIVRAPLTFAGLFGAAFVIWLPFAAVCRGLTALLTTPGVFVLVILLVILLGRGIAYTMVFPCSVSMIAKSLEREAAAAMRAQLSSSLSSLDALCAAFFAARGDASSLLAQVDSARARLAEAQAFHAVLLKQQDDGTLSSHAAYIAHYLGLTVACASIVIATLDARNAAVVGADEVRRLPCIVPDDIVTRWGGTSGVNATRTGAVYSSTPPATSPEIVNAQLVLLPPPLVALPHLFDARLGTYPSRGDTAALVNCVLESRSLTLSSALALTHKLVALTLYLTPWLEILPRHRSVIDLKDLARVAGLAESEAVKYTARRVTGAASSAGVAAVNALAHDIAPVPMSYGEGDAATAATTRRLLQVLTGSTDAGIPPAYCGAPAEPMTVSEAASSETTAPATQSTAAGEQQPAQAPQTFAQRRAMLARLARAAWRTVAATAWRIFLFFRAFVLAHRIPTPVAGLDYFRAELLLRYDATQLWVGCTDVAYVPSCGTAPQTIKARLAALSALGLADVAEAIGAVAAARSAARASTLNSREVPPSPVTVSTEGQPAARRGSAATRALAQSLSGVGAPEWLIRSCVGAQRDGEDDARVSAFHGVGHAAGGRSRAELRTLASAAPAVVLICNPNAGLYEHAHRSSEWLSFYTALGLDVVLWNYRGYGRSEGVPSPSALRRDATTLATFLRADLGARRIIVHGESLGGIAACHLAHAGVVDLLIADRTFDTLPRTARAMLGAWAETALMLVTGWRSSNAGAFVSAAALPRATPRIVCTDPKDRVIDWGASLAVGVALRALAEKRAHSIVLHANDVQTDAAVTQQAAHVRSQPVERESSMLRHLAERLLVRQHVVPRVAVDGDALKVRYVASWLYFLVLRFAESALPALALGRVAIVGAPGWAARARTAASGLSSAPDVQHNAPIAAATETVASVRRRFASVTVPPAPSAAREPILTYCLQRHDYHLPAGSSTESVAAVWIDPSDEASHRMSALVAAAAAGVTVCTMFDRYINAALQLSPPGETTKLGKAVPHASTTVAAVVHETAAALHASATLAPQHTDGGTWAAAPVSGSNGSAMGGAETRRDPRLIAMLDSELWSHSASSSTAEHAALVALAALAGTDNGFGLRLGEAVRDGVAGVEAWASAALCWGFELQDGCSPLNVALAAAVRDVGNARAVGDYDDDDGDEKCDCGSSEHGDGEHRGPRGSPFSRLAPHLRDTHESSVATTLRRLMGLRGIPPVHATSAGAAQLSSPVDEALAALLELHALRDQRNVLSLTAGGTRTIESTLDTAVTSPQGIAVPLTCGHNAAWTRVEASFVARIILATVESW